MTTVDQAPTEFVRCAAPPDIVAVLGNAIASHRPLIDYGLAHAALGHAPPAPPAEHTRFAQEADPANRGILEHYVRDLTVRAAAGITIGDLQEALAATNQFAPIDADDDITLGEAIHHNMWGPLRVGYGSIRDLLLGLGYIDGEGRDIRVGGRTVKNVAGYDVTRFMVGSLGELGVVHEATLRTYAIPESVLEVEMTVKDPAIFDERGTGKLIFQPNHGIARGVLDKHPHDPKGKLDIVRSAGYWLKDAAARGIRHLCWDGCMFPNAVLEDGKTWNTILDTMLKVRDAQK